MTADLRKVNCLKCLRTLARRTLAAPGAPQEPGPARAHLGTITVCVDGLKVFDVVREALEDAGSVVDDTVADEHREVAKQAVEIVVDVVMEALGRESLIAAVPGRSSGHEEPDEPDPHDRAFEGGSIDVESIHGPDDEQP